MEPDGYFNIWHTVVQPGSRFQNQDRHELYCLGHLLEAAVAYYEATGRARFLDLMDGRLADLLAEISDLEKPWRRTQDTKYCAWCDFKNICGR